MTTREKISEAQSMEIEDQSLHDEVPASLDIKEKFLAKNASPSQLGFIERAHYRDDAYPVSYPLPKPIDVWYNKGLYGKVDPNYNSVITQNEWTIEELLVTQSIKKIASKGGEVFAMNFVVDAFEDLVEHMNVAANIGSIYAKGSSLVPLEPKRGFSPGESRYKEYLVTLYQGFAGSFLEQNQNYKKVTNLKEFMKTFSDFLQRTMPDFPLSTSGYVLSAKFPLASTGLVIEIANGAYGDDEPKYSEFISDKNFLFFVSSAQKFGFRVDKNAPWRLIADIKSEKMQDYMKNYPEKPHRPVDVGHEPRHPCNLAESGDPAIADLFSQYLLRKIEFTQLPENECSLGKIDEIICDANDPTNAQFRVHTYRPGSEEDLLDSYGPVEGDTQAQWAEYLQVYSPTQQGLAGRLSGRHERSHLVIIAMEVDGQFKWLNIPRDEEWTAWDAQPGQRSRWVAPGDQNYPIAMKFSQTTNSVTQWRWKIEVAPPGNMDIFWLDEFDLSAGTAELIPAPMSSDRNDGVPNITTIIDQPGGRIRFMPTTDGDYVFSVEGYNMDVPGVPRLVGKEYLTLKVCHYSESDLNSLSQTTIGGNISLRDLWSMLNGALTELWSIYSDRIELNNHTGSPGGAQPCVDIIAEGNPQAGSSGDTRIGQECPPDAQARQGSAQPYIGWRDIHDLEQRASLFPNRAGGENAACRVSTQTWDGDYIIALLLLLKIYNCTTAQSTNMPGWEYPGFNGPDRPGCSTASFKDALAPQTDCMTVRHSQGQAPHEDLSYALALLSKVIRGGLPPTLTQGGNIGNRWGLAGFAVPGSQEEEAWITYFEDWARSGNASSHGHGVSWNLAEDFINDFGQLCTSGRQQQNEPSDIYAPEWPTVGSDPPICFPEFVWRTTTYCLLDQGRDSWRYDQNTNTTPQQQFNEWYEACLGFVPIPLEGDTQDEVSDCNEGSPTTVPIIMSANLGPEDYFILRENDNKEFQDKRAAYSRAVIDYPNLMEAWRDRVEAMRIYNLHLAAWQKVQDEFTYLDFENLFKRQFQKTIELDIPALKEYILNVYNSYVMSHEWLVTTKIKKGGVGTVRCMKKREPVTMTELENLYPASFWAQFYFGLRIMESRKNLSSTVLKNFQLKAGTILSANPVSGLKDVLKIIDEEIKGVVKERISLTPSDLYDII